MKKVDWYIFTGLYLSVLAYIVWYTLSHDVINADFGREYEVYLRELVSGRWNYIPDSLVNASPISTYLPALLQRTFHLSDTTLFFKLTPVVFFALLPSFTYLICRKYLGYIDSIMAAIFVATSFYISYAPEHGRVEIGWTISVILFYSLLNNKKILAVAMAALLPFGHYGAFFMILPILGICTIVLNKKRPAVFFSFVVLALTGLLWCFWVAKAPGVYFHSFVISLFNNISKGGDVAGLLRAPNLYNIGAFVGFWASVSLSIWGFILSWREKIIDPLLMISGGVFYLYIAMAFCLPFLSRFYGLGRIYFTGMPIIVLFLAKGSGRYPSMVLALFVFYHILYNGWYVF